jgi:hypothetical protein
MFLVAVAARYVSAQGSARDGRHNSSQPCRVRGCRYEYEKPCTESNSREFWKICSVFVQNKGNQIHRLCLLASEHTAWARPSFVYPVYSVTLRLYSFGPQHPEARHPGDSGHLNLSFPPHGLFAKRKLPSSLSEIYYGEFLSLLTGHIPSVHLGLDPVKSNKNTVTRYRSISLHSIRIR